MTRMALLGLGLVALLLPGAGTAGRLDGEFVTRQADQADGTNEACVAADGFLVGGAGRVTGTSGGCTVEIVYGTQQPHKVNATALKGSKTNGSIKASQSVSGLVFVDVFDTDGEGEGVCDEAFEATNDGETEKCKATTAIKGTAVDGDDDITQSGRASASCELGENGANLDTSEEEDGVQPPSAAQFGVVVAAFADRKDVKVDEKGKLRVKHKGVPDTETPDCGF